MMKFSRRAAFALTSLIVICSAACARPGTAADFEYYLLSLSWSPQYCSETRRDQELQCAQPHAFVAHGLWPQNEHGYSKDCDSRQRVDNATIDRLMNIMPSRGLIIHEWRAHGSCSGLDADTYFSTVERAYHSIRIPERYAHITGFENLPADELRNDLRATNPGVPANGLVLQCSGPYLQEIRICLDRQLQPRACGSDIREHCGDHVTLRPVR